MWLQEHLQDLSPEQRNELEAMLMRFEESWTPNRLDEFVDQLSQRMDDSFRTAALNELVKIDLHRQWSHGSGAFLDSYLQRFAELGSSENVSPHLIHAEYEARTVHEGKLNKSIFRKRFPQQYEHFLELAKGAEKSDGLVNDAKTLPPIAHASIDTSRIDGPQDTTAGQALLIGIGLPEEFGRYRIIRELGSGAMGSVHLAHDSQLDRQVAIKTPSFNGIEHDAMVERFYREARAAAKLQHRNICPVYDVGEIDGRHFISMAFVKGRCMSEYIKPGKLPPPKTSAVLVHRLALALAEAHRQNVIHRDLKPANIMIDNHREPVVMDFGLARRIDVESRMTQTGMAVGTPAYMSPEQVRGEQDTVGPASDIYALGVIFYELLTGQLPFQGQIAQVVYGIVHDEPTPPSKIRPELSEALEQICLRMMAKSPSDRFQSMDEVANAIKKQLQSDKKSSQQDAISQSNRRVSKAGTELESHSETNALNAFFAAQGESATQSATRTLVESSKPTESKIAQRSLTTATGGRSISPRMKWLLGGIGGVFLLAVALGIILIFKTPYGTLRIETVGELDGLEVLIDGENVNLQDALTKRATDHDLQIKLGDAFLDLKPDTSQFTLSREGDQRRISVSVDGVELSSNKFTVARNGETVLRIELLADDASTGENPVELVSDQGEASSGATELSNNESSGTGEPQTASPQLMTLFNGENLNGWEVLGHPGWSVVDGVIVGEPPRGKTAKQGSWLMNTREFEDFELAFEYKLAADGNSGVFIRATREQGLDENPGSPEVQLLDDTSSRFDNVDNTQLNGALWNALPANPGLRLEPNQWHRMKIRVQNDHLQVWSNDRKILDGKHPDLVNRGNRIGMQLWNGTVQFREIGIRELPSEEKVVPSNSTRNIPWTATDNSPTFSPRTIEAGADMRVLALSPDGTTFAATGIDTPGQISIWDAETGSRLRRFRVDDGFISDLSFSPDGEHLVVSIGRSVKVVKSADGRLSRSREFPTFVSMAPFHQRTWVACIYSERPATEKDKDPNDPPRILCIWDWEANKILCEQVVRAIGNTPPHDPAVSPNGKYLSLCMRHLHVRFDIVSEGDSVKLTNQTSTEQLTLPRGPIVFSPDGRLAAASRKNRRSLFVVLDATTGRILHELDGERSSDAGLGSRLAFTADGKYLVATDMEGGVSLWNAQTGTLVRRLYAHESELEKYGPPGLLVTKDGRLITAGGPTDRTIKISQLSLSP